MRYKLFILVFVVLGAGSAFVEFDKLKTFRLDGTNDLESDSYQIGDVVHDFSLKNVDDAMVSMSSFTDANGFAIIFTCNHCPYSVAYEDRIMAIDKKYKELGYPVIAINPNNPESYPTDSFENMKKRAVEKGFEFPYLFDEGQKVFPKFGAKKTPHVFVVNKEKKGLILKYIGAIDDNYSDEYGVKDKFLESALDNLIDGVDVKVKETKAIGCSIKR